MHRDDGYEMPVPGGDVPARAAKPARGGAAADCAARLQRRPLLAVGLVLLASLAVSQLQLGYVTASVRGVADQVAEAARQGDKLQGQLDTAQTTIDAKLVLQQHAADAANDALKLRVEALEGGVAAEVAGLKAENAALAKKVTSLMTAVSELRRKGAQAAPNNAGVLQTMPPHPAPRDEAAGGGPPAQRRDASAKTVPKLYEDILDLEERNVKRRAKVKEEFEHSWRGYVKHAWGHDELKPVTRSYKDWVETSKGLGLSIFDAMTTMALMNMTKDVDLAVDFVTKHADFGQDLRISTFETVIRVVASLLSTYELTGERHPALLRQAVVVMDKLLWAFNTSTGLFHQQVNLKNHHHWNPEWTGGGSILSELGSVQLEMRTLSYHTGDPTYDMKATHIASVLAQRCPADMLCPTYIEVADATFRDDRLTLGALGDSFYEYLLKQYLLTGKTEKKYRAQALTALETISTRLLRYSTPSRQAYLAEFSEGNLDHKMDELACFAGGMFALTALEVKDSEHPLQYTRTAEELVTTCFKMFASQNTGLAPESVEFHGGADFSNGPAQYLLRPETVESLFYVWRLTKKAKYRDMAWEIFTNMMEYCRVPSGGYTGLVNVNIVPPETDDVQQSFWLAETMKYLYLIFSDDDLVPLHDWVFNTEAHPLRIRSRDPMDVWRDWEAVHGGAMPWQPPTVERVTPVETAGMLHRRNRAGGRVVAPADSNAQEDPDPEVARQQQEDNAAAQQQVQSEQEQRNAAERQRQVRERDADGPPTTRFPENPNDVAERRRRELNAATQIRQHAAAIHMAGRDQAVQPGGGGSGSGSGSSGAAGGGVVDQGKGQSVED
jgi:mannosyl-oligosaccharide alpha-1,2-mannosidase